MTYLTPGEQAWATLCRDHIWRSVDHGARPADETCFVIISSALSFAEENHGNEKWAERVRGELDAIVPASYAGGWLLNDDDAQALVELSWNVECSPPDGLYIDTDGEVGMTWLIDIRTPAAKRLLDIHQAEEE